MTTRECTHKNKAKKLGEELVGDVGKGLRATEGTIPRVEDDFLTVSVQSVSGATKKRGKGRMMERMMWKFA